MTRREKRAHVFYDGLSFKQQAALMRILTRKAAMETPTVPTELTCKNCRQPNHPVYDRKYDGYCLNCANAGASDKDERIAELERELDQARAELITPLLKRVQPCGCKTCVCDGHEACYGCGARQCGKKEDCVFWNTDTRTRIEYEDAPSYAQLRKSHNDAIDTITAMLKAAGWNETLEELNAKGTKPSHYIFGRIRDYHGACVQAVMNAASLKVRLRRLHGDKCTEENCMLDGGPEHKEYFDQQHEDAVVEEQRRLDR